MSPGASYNDEKLNEMTMTEEAVMIVDELLQCSRCTDKTETTLTIEEEASMIVEELLAAVLVSQKVSAKMRRQIV